MSKRHVDMAVNFFAAMFFVCGGIGLFGGLVVGAYYWFQWLRMVLS